jgi:hypothetical protein
MVIGHDADQAHNAAAAPAPAGAAIVLGIQGTGTENVNVEGDGWVLLGDCMVVGDVDIGVGVGVVGVEDDVGGRVVGVSDVEVDY